MRPIVPPEPTGIDLATPGAFVRRRVELFVSRAEWQYLVDKAAAYEATPGMVLCADARLRWAAIRDTIHPTNTEHDAVEDLA